MNSPAGNLPPGAAPGDDAAAANPLLDPSEPFAYDAVRPEHITPAVERLLADCRAAVAAVVEAREPATWSNVVEPLEAACERLSHAWGAVSHLNAVVDTPQLRAEFNANLPRITAFWTALSQNVALYGRYRALAGGPDFAAWSPARRRVVDNELRDFRLGGAELDAAAKERMASIRERQAQLSTRFAENVLDATNAFALHVAPRDEAILAGIPDDVRAMYREAAAANGKDGSQVSLHLPSYMPLMQYAHDRGLREKLYHAYAIRASELGPTSWDNSAVMVELLQLRDEQARLLGYPNYAELSLVPKMATSSAEVLRFLRDLGARARPHAQRDIAELRGFAAAELGIADLQPWDIAYASEKLRQSRYAYSEQEVKSYFPATRVLDGLFRVIEALFGVRFAATAAPTWHPDVRHYRVATRDRDATVGHFYLDLFARDHKRGGAWMDVGRIRRRVGAGIETPVTLVTCNFSPPVGGRDAFLTHNEVLTLFHEFGHGLHHLLTQVDESQVAGIRGVEWDAVELPSQFLENFAWEWDVLQLLGRRPDDAAPLPRALYDRMRAARNFQSGMQMVRQLEFALFDMLAHSLPDEQRRSAADLVALAARVRDEVAVVFPPAYHRGAHGFSHIFAGGYAAGYYSYKWAEVLSADCYAAFEEGNAVLDATRGGRFRAEILEVGGSRPAIDSFVAFRGRPPQIDALLRHSGMTT
ncbi:MAG TPA: M3 family metallopeptidase [Burkholderiaceae bacterium]|nr:M3 family metallopeptidase [Burkholderiaceae bacterium]